MGTANILIVCTGNVCRSPAAAFLLADRLGSAAHNYSIHTAGIKAAAGSPIDPTMRDLLAHRGIQATGSLARDLTVELLESADLILTASTSHRTAVVRMLPRVVGKTLTLKQLARYAPIILNSGPGPMAGAERVRWILSAVPQARARAAKSDDSIADPLGKSRRSYRVAIEELEQACAKISSILRDTAKSAVAPDTANPPNNWWLEMSTVELPKRAARQ